MSGPAKVYTSEAIEAVRIAILSFIDHVGDALTELAAEMRRTQEWLEHDRPGYWKNQTRIGMDQVHEAQQALHRCLMFPVADERPSCYEERAALKKAQARLAYCEQKSERVRHWQQTLRHELFEYEGRISQLVKLVEIDAPQAIGVLNKIMRHLEEYNAVRAADPRSAYDDVAMVRAIWAEEEGKSTEMDVTSREITPERDREKRENPLTQTPRSPGEMEHEPQRHEEHQGRG
jgi:hypothetical protein